MKTSLSQKIRGYLPGLFSLALLGVLVFYHGLFLPFILALALVYWLGPSLRLWQKRLKNWTLTVSSFLIAVVLGLLLFFSLSAGFILRDLERFNQSFELLWSDNKENLDRGAQEVVDWLNTIYPAEDLEAELQEQMKALQASKDSSSLKDQLDVEAISSGFDKVKRLFIPKETEESQLIEWPKFGFWYQLGSFLLYFVMGLLYYDYFEGLKKRYGKSHLSETASLFWRDFEQSFVRYFRLRSRIIAWQMPLFILSFVLLDLPGTFLYLILVFLLLYIPYLHYILLLPMALSALVVSTELQWAYWLVYGLILLTFILNSILEEAVLIPRIMEENIGINPVIMILGLSFWTYLLGTWGVLIGIPLTSLGIIYLKRHLFPYWFPEHTRTEGLKP